ncbi:MAG: DNA-directed RNA polymerase subunit omega [Lentisphaerae bacterium]|nr:DNA-directed RNA polymerase subunit omega [Lentisphaerota bacterium]
MKVQPLEAARQRVPGLSVLINMISLRVRQLIAGHRPLVKPASLDESLEDIAIREVAEGKLVAEIDFLKSQPESAP